MKTFQPFSNGTAAMFWDETNCGLCKRRPCGVRLNLDACRNLTEKQCYQVGGTMCEEKNGNFVHMPDRCHLFTEVKPVLNKKQISTNQLELFKEKNDTDRQS